MKVELKGECGQGQEGPQSWKGVGPQGPKLDEELPALGCLNPVRGWPLLCLIFKLTCEEGAKVV